MSLPELDDFDRHLLTRMQADAHCKAETLAAEIGLSASAVQRRLKRLRERGVIQAEVAVLDPAVTGRGLTLIAGLTIGRDNYAALPRLKAWLAAEPAVQRRLKRLRERGVIQAEVAVLDPAVMGRGLTLIAGLTIGRDNYAALPRLKAWLAAEPAVQQAWYVTGEADLVALVLAPDMPAYDALCARLMAEVPQLTRITTQVVIEPLKRSLALPVV